MIPIYCCLLHHCVFVLFGVLPLTSGPSLNSNTEYSAITHHDHYAILFFYTTRAVNFLRKPNFDANPILWATRRVNVRVRSSLTFLSSTLTLLASDDSQLQWPYCPSLPAAIAITACFATLTLAHLFQAILYRKTFCWVICMASAWETVGFTMRLLGAREPRTQTYSVGSNLLILLSPLWVNAFVYMVMGRMVYYWLPNKSVWKLKARTMSTWFVWLDVVTFLVQATGGSMIDGDDLGTAKMGLYICKSSPAICSNLASFFTPFSVDLDRYGWNWSPAGFSTAVRLHHDSIPSRRPPEWAPSTHFLASRTVLPIRCTCSYYCGCS